MAQRMHLHSAVMKTKAIPPYKLLLSGSLALGLAAVSLPAFADDEAEIDIDDDKIKVEVEDGEAKIKANGEVEVDGENGAEALRIARATLAEQEAKQFRSSLTTGYVIPKDRYIYMDPVPQTYVERLPETQPNVVYRTYDGQIYAVDSTTYKVVDIVKTDQAGNTIEVRTTAPADDLTTVKANLVEGYVIPTETYVYLNRVPDRYITQLPPSPTGTIYRYLDGTVYAVNPQTYKVVDVITITENASELR